MYKNLSVIKRDAEIQTHPVSFGQTFIHTSSTTIPYYHFLQQIAVQLTEEEMSMLTIGGDDELSFKT